MSDAQLFRLPSRVVIEVGGADRLRWLDGMISADVASLAVGEGAWGLLLTRQGRVVADLHVLSRADCLWLELEGSVAKTVEERLAGYVIADDVTLAERDASRLGLEGTGAASVLEAAGGAPVALAIDAWCELGIAGETVTVAAYGFTGQPAFQLFAPRAAEADVAAALLEAGAVETGAETLECLRVEAGLPRVGAELDESVLPAEARLEAAISETKGCYTGQEVVTRMRTRGRVAHLLVGLRLEAGPLPERGAEIIRDGARIGQLTSAVLSPAEGAIGLGFVKHDAAAAGTEVRVGGANARIVELPMRADT
ncbi:MAG: glycine cleavage T C-terminal barrel domain-containing protein [Myxococcota bacterium]